MNINETERALIRAIVAHQRRSGTTPRPSHIARALGFSVQRTDAALKAMRRKGLIEFPDVRPIRVKPKAAASAGI